MKLDTKSIILDDDPHKLIIIRNQIYKVKVKNKDCKENTDIFTGRFLYSSDNEYLCFDMSRQFESSIISIKIENIIEIEEVFIK